MYVFTKDELAAHDEQVRAEVAERIAQAIEAANYDHWKRSHGMRPNAYDQAMVAAARIAREGGTR